MQTVILAEGKGTRLRPLTDHTPKPLISINDKPFLQYQLELIGSFTTDVLLLVGYLRNKIEKYFGDGSRFGVKIDYCFEKDLLGTGGVLKNAEVKLREKFVLLNGGTYLSMDFRKLVDYFHQCKGIGVIAVYDNSEAIAPNNIAIDKSNLVTVCDRKNPRDMTHTVAGAMVFKKDVLNFIPKGKICSLEEDIFPKLIEAKQPYSFPTNRRFYDIGSRKGLEVINRVLK